MRLAMFTWVVLFACSAKSTEDTPKHEAIFLRNSMMKKANEIEHRLNELQKDSSVNQDSVELLSAALELWKADLVEVPGNEEHDHGDHDHEYRHGKIPEVTQEQMLPIQKELDE